MTHHTSDRPRSPQAPNAAPIEPPDARTVEQASGEIRVEMRSKRRAIVLRLVFLLVSGVALYVLWPSLLTVFEIVAGAARPEPGVVPRDAGARGPELRVHLGPAAHRVAHRPLVRRGDGPALGERPQPHRAGRRGRGRGAAVAHADRFRGRRRPRGDRAHRRVADQHGHALRAAGADPAGRTARTAGARRARRRPPGWAGPCSPWGSCSGGGCSSTTDCCAGSARERSGCATGTQRGKPPTTDLPARLVVQRDEIRDALGDTWWKALLFSLGNWLFDYLALLAAITAWAHGRARPWCCWRTPRRWCWP